MSTAGRRARLAIGTRVVLGALLAVTGAVLAIDLSDWRYLRLDLTASGRNSLDASVLDLLDRLPEKIVVDVFFRPLRPPYEAVSLEAQGRMLELLGVAQNARRGTLEVRAHDLARLEEVQARQKELGVEGVNLVVYSAGARRAVQRLFGEIAVVDWGVPTQADALYLKEQGLLQDVDLSRWNPGLPRPPSLSAFRGEETLAEGLLKVASAGSPRVVFTRGSGEPALDGTESRELSALARALEQDGFEVATWDPSQAPGPPADAAVIACLGATQAYPPGTLARLEEWVEAGGALVAAPSLDEVERDGKGGIAELLFGYGMVAEPGIVCVPVVDPATGRRVDGSELCSWLQIGQGGLSPSQEITQTLLDRGRRVQFSFSPSFRRGQAADMLLIDLVSSPQDGWRDQDLGDGRHDFRFDARAETREARRLAMLATGLVATPQADGSTRTSRVLGVASVGFFSNGLFDVNHDFALSAFNWMAHREYRVRVSPLAHPEGRLDLARSRALPVLTYALYLGLPGLCIAVGCLLAWRRRS